MTSLLRLKVWRGFAPAAGIMTVKPPPTKPLLRDLVIEIEPPAERLKRS